MTAAHTTVMDAIGNRLATITIANGHPFTLNKLERARIKPWESYDYPAATYGLLNDSITRRNYGDEEHRVSIALEVHHASRDTNPSDLAATIAQAVVHALHRAPAAPLVSDAVSVDLGGLVTSLTVTGFEYAIGEGQSPIVYAVFTLEARYAAPYGDPNTITP